MSKTFFITGAGRGMGLHFAQEALTAGHQVVATGRNPRAVEEALGGARPGLLPVRLDITSLTEAEAAVEAAVRRFDGIDVLVNNAANCYLGYFEELSPQQIQDQLTTNLIGPMNVTRAVLPVMRRRRSGHLVAISSTSGFAGYEFCSAYAASKFGLEGWMESLHQEVAPYGIKTTIVEPGAFRTTLREPTSTTYAEGSVDDYAERTAAQVRWWDSTNGMQPGDPARLARAVLHLTEQAEPPLRFLAGRDAVQAAEDKITELRRVIDTYRGLSTSLDHEDAA